MLGRKRCPHCAERIRKEAQVCRFCGRAAAKISLSKDEKPRTSRNWAIAVPVAIIIAGAAILGYAASRDVAERYPPAPFEPTTVAAPRVAEPETPSVPALGLGETLEWQAENAPPELKRKAGPLLVTITKWSEDELVAPVVEVRHGDALVTMEGELASPSYTNRITVLQNLAGAAPVIMLQSFTGGAHCCNHVQLAGFSNGRLKQVDLGTWDGDEIALPKDVSGDGIADFVVSDDRFLYAFAAYAMSHSPPKILNVVGGQVSDVSDRPAFRRFYREAMASSRDVCRTGDDGMVRNGACPAYVAAAARTGKLDEAWSEMLAAYDASADWELPTGCAIATAASCPTGREIVFKSYPEALLNFLQKTGYIRRDWRPPEMIPDPDEVVPEQSAGRIIAP